jgi:hypothetical protein
MPQTHHLENGARQNSILHDGLWAARHCLSKLLLSSAGVKVAVTHASCDTVEILTCLFSFQAHQDDRI